MNEVPDAVKRGVDVDDMLVVAITDALGLWMSAGVGLTVVLRA